MAFSEGSQSWVTAGRLGLGATCSHVVEGKKGTKHKASVVIFPKALFSSSELVFVLLDGKIERDPVTKQADTSINSNVLGQCI